MHTTYELYPEGEEGRFEPVTVRTLDELMDAARRLIAEREVRAVEVRHFGTHLFTVAA